MGSVTTSPSFAQYSRIGLVVGSWWLVVSSWRGELELEGEGFISRRGAESAEGFWSWGSTPDPECELIDLCGSESRSIRRNVSEAPLRTFGVSEQQVVGWLVVGGEGESWRGSWSWRGKVGVFNRVARRPRFARECK